MDTFGLKGKIALITGGNRGIGKALALAFGEAGAHVVIAARKVDLSQQVVTEIQNAGGNGSFLEIDLAKDEDIDRLVSITVEQHSRIDILINNSGISPFVKKSEEVTKEMWSQVIQVNLLAPFLLCREVGKVMIQQNWGRIINIASIGGIVALPRQIAYCATKAALIQMTRVLAVEWAEKYNITVNAIAPGYTATDLTAGMMASEKISKNLLQRNPSKRFGNVGEMAGAALYLASESASYTTGTVLTVDGGVLAY